MKKKSSLFFLIFIFSLISFTKVYSKQVCNLFFDDIKNNFSEYELDFLPQWEQLGFGFNLQNKFNKSSDIGDIDTWVYKRSKEDYYIVGKINLSSLVEKISTNDLIISINGKDIRNEELSIEGKQLEDIFPNEDELDFVFRNISKSENYNLKLKKLDGSISEPYADVYIRSLEIDEKNNKINAGLVLEYQHLCSDGCTEDSLFYKSAIKYLLQTDKDGVKYTEGCNFTTDKWTSLRAVDPARGFEFENIYSIDQDMIKESYHIRPYSKEAPNDVELQWENDLTIDYKSEGIFTFQTNFDLRNFPFDKQKINLYLVNRHYPMETQTLMVSDYTKRELIKFTEKNLITGWNVISNYISYEPYKGPNDVTYYDGVKFQIEIERKHSYYLYKVIIPILLILMVCWSSLWVAPREIESRLTITIVCLLSLIAYNFVIDKELPKLEYLTILDWIILTSYVYATIPNFLSIYSHKLILNKKNAMCSKVESLGKKYGITSYFLIILLIIAFNVSINPENASALISWMG